MKRFIVWLTLSCLVSLSSQLITPCPSCVGRAGKTSVPFFKDEAYKTTPPSQSAPKAEQQK